eukprot:GHVS01012479.1.p1 GENE.GHVS01012479.1~~GHVS01012479.1.p1  ORF type:complete len:106 (-),score=2.76 GHVS01012479.1:512-829(-)
MASSKCADYFSSYAAYHRNPVNKIIHIIFVPVIVFSIINIASLFTPSMLSCFCPPSTNVCQIIRQHLPTPIDNFSVLWVAYQMFLSFRCSPPIGVITWGLYAGRT